MGVRPLSAAGFGFVMLRFILQFPLRARFSGFAGRAGCVFLTTGILPQTIGFSTRGVADAY